MSHELMEPHLSWKQVASTLVGGAICLPTLLIGFMLGKTISFHAAITAIVLGNALLLVMGLSIASLTARTRKNASELFQEILGTSGGKALSALLFSILAVWFGVQSETMADALASLFLNQESVLKSLAISILSVLISCLIVITSRKIDSIAKLCDVAIPIMIALIILPLFLKEGKRACNDVEILSMSSELYKGIPLIIAASIAAVIDLPTFLKECQTLSDMRKVTIALFGGGTCLMEIFGVLLANKNASTLIEALTLQESDFASLSNGSTDLLMPLSSILVGALLLLAGWTTNAANLFSMEQTLKAISPRSFASKSFLIAGAVAVLLSLFNLMEQLSVILSLLSMPLIAMVGVTITASTAQGITLKRQAILISIAMGSAAGSYGVLVNEPILIEPMIDTFSITLILLQLLHMRSSKPVCQYE